LGGNLAAEFLAGGDRCKRRRRAGADKYIFLRNSEHFNLAGQIYERAIIIVVGTPLTLTELCRRADKSRV